MSARKLIAGFAIVVAGGLIAATPAAAKCTRLAFSVNDYGKDGPTKDAKALLDKYIAEWTAQRGIKGYRTGKKDVKCELFLDFGVFDEHTCRAEATVCWGDGGAPAANIEAAAPKADAPVAKKKANAPAPAVKETASVPVPKKKEPAAAPASAAKKAPAVGEPINTPVKAPPPAKKKADQPS